MKSILTKMSMIQQAVKCDEVEITHSKTGGLLISLRWLDSNKHYSHEYSVKEIEQVADENVLLTNIIRRANDCVFRSG